VSIDPDLAGGAFVCCLSDEELDVTSLLVGVGDASLAPLGALEVRVGCIRGGRRESGVSEAPLIVSEDAGGGELSEEGKVVVVAGDMLVEALGPRDERSTGGM
jgi:hypothetical protein